MRIDGGEMQLVMLVSVILENNTVKKLTILVDTGARANLIRMAIGDFHGFQTQQWQFFELVPPIVAKRLREWNPKVSKSPSRKADTLL